MEILLDIDIIIYIKFIKKSSNRPDSIMVRPRSMARGRKDSEYQSKRSNLRLCFPSMGSHCYLYSMQCNNRLGTYVYLLNNEFTKIHP